MHISEILLLANILINGQNAVITVSKTSNLHQSAVLACLLVYAQFFHDASQCTYIKIHLVVSLQWSMVTWVNDDLAMYPNEFWDAKMLHIYLYTRFVNWLML